MACRCLRRTWRPASSTNVAITGRRRPHVHQGAKRNQNPAVAGRAGLVPERRLQIPAARYALRSRAGHAGRPPSEETCEDTIAVGRVRDLVDPGSADQGGAVDAATATTEKGAAAARDHGDRSCGGEPCDAVTRGLLAFFDRRPDGLGVNGRACADCHMVTDNFQLSPASAGSEIPAAAIAAPVQPAPRTIRCSARWTPTTSGSTAMTLVTIAICVRTGS